MEPGHKLLLGSLTVCFVIVGLNTRYFLAHLEYALFPPDDSARLVASVDIPEQPPDSTTDSQADDRETKKGEPDRLIIESLGIEAPVIYIDEKGEDAYQAALLRGVVHFPGTALPGEFGNGYIFGHSSDFAWNRSPYRAIFALLTEIKLGAEISLSDAEGRIHIYRVTGTKVVSPKDMSVLDQQGNAKKILTLQTSYPLGTALRRFIVTAEME
jgi:LPXTG-site transpeptidase (sortase) family protein